MVKEKFNDELGLKLDYENDCDYANLIDEDHHVYIQVDADCKNYKKWLDIISEHVEKEEVCLYVGFTGFSYNNHEDLNDFEFAYVSNIMVTDPLCLNNLTLDIIRVKIHQWCDKDVKISKFNQKLSQNA